MKLTKKKLKEMVMNEMKKSRLDEVSYRSVNTIRTAVFDIIANDKRLQDTDGKEVGHRIALGIAAALKKLIKDGFIGENFAYNFLEGHENEFKSQVDSILRNL